ncbi:MAG: hypothetical protein J0L80_07265 [Chitinophagales bacterium]|nr:hypothetical protein [Chitinophagales bacterium]
MKKIHILVLLMMLFSLACNKNKRNDVAGDKYISGRLFFVNAMNNGVPEPIGNVRIELAVEDGSKWYTYTSDTTDAAGYFFFDYLGSSLSNNGIVQKKKYRLTAYYTSDTVVYSVDKEIEVSETMTDVKLELTPAQDKQNGIIYNVTDADGGAIKDCRICIFNNASAANANCTGSFSSKQTNNYGKAKFMALPTGSYLAFCRAEINGVVYEKTDTLTGLAALGVKVRTIALPAKPTKAKGLQFVVRDTLGGIIKDCTVCLFTSSVLANDSCNGHYASKSTGADGKVMFDALPVGNIYSYFIITAGSKTLKANVVVSYADTGMQIIDTVRVR